MVKRGLIGLTLSLSATCLLVLVILLDVLLAKFKSWDVRGLRRVLTQSSNHNLLLYELPFFMLMIGVPVLVEETQNPLLQDMLPTIWIQVGVWIPTILLMASLNILRFERLGLDRKHEMSVYHVAEEIVEKSISLEEGLDKGLEYVQSTESNFRTVSEKGFLQYLFSRNDELSTIATKKLDALEEENK